MFALTVSEGMEWNSLQERHIVGASMPRKEGRDKVTGAARYVDDMVLPGMLHGATVRSNIARGKIKKISFGENVEKTASP
jgi:CO/xanthine dehydrogenase Mo-binding subunit